MDLEHSQLHHHHVDHGHHQQTTLENLIAMNQGLAAAHGQGLGLATAHGQGPGSQPSSRTPSRQSSAHGSGLALGVGPGSGSGHKLLIPVSPLNSARGGYNNASGEYNSARDRGVPPVFVSNLIGHIRHPPDTTPRQNGMSILPVPVYLYPLPLPSPIHKSLTPVPIYLYIYTRPIRYPIPHLSIPSLPSRTMYYYPPYVPYPYVTPSINTSQSLPSLSTPFLPI